MGIKIISINGVPYTNSVQSAQNNNNQMQQQRIANQQQPQQQNQNIVQQKNQQQDTSVQPTQKNQLHDQKSVDKQNFLVSIQFSADIKKIVLVFTLIFGQHADFQLGWKIQNLLQSKKIQYSIRADLHSYNFSGQRVYVVEVDHKIISSYSDLQQLKDDKAPNVNTIQYIYPALPFNQFKYIRQIFQYSQKTYQSVNCLQYCGQLPQILNAYQVKLIKQIIEKSYQTNLLFLPPGFGKSAIALYVSLYFKRPIVVIAPQMLHFHWVQQINTFVNQFENNQNLYNYKKLTDGIFSQIKYKNHMLALNPKEYKYAYQNYDVFRDKSFKNYILVATLTELLKLTDAGELSLSDIYLIVDESHEYREVTALKTQNAMSVCKQVNLKLLMTATPFVNQISDIYVLLWLNDFPLSAKEFTTRYARLESAGKYMKFIGLQHENELRQVFQQYLVQLSKQEVQKLKSSTSQPSGVSTSLPRLPMIKRYVCSFSGASEQFLLSESSSMNCSIQYKKASERKQDVSFEILRSFASKKMPFIVYFVNLTNAEFFKDFPDSKCITGNILGSERAKIVKQFQDGEFQALFATIDSISTGLDVTRAKVIFWLQMEWTMALFEQAEGRIRRINSTYDTVYSIVLTDQNYWDNRVRNIISFKKTLGDWMCHSDALDGVENSTNSVQYNSDFRFEQLTSLDQIV